METTVLRPFAGCLVSLAREFGVKHLCYMVKAGENVETIRTEMEQTQRVCQDINNRIEAEKRQGRKPTAVVEGWIKDVQKCQGEVRKLKHDYDSRGCVISCCACSFNCISVYRSGREAVKLRLLKVKGLLDQGRGFVQVTEEQLPPPAQVIPTSSRALGLEAHLSKTIDFLKDEEDGKFLLGIWGSGGVGKTTLLTEINNSLATTQHHLGFHHVIRVVASQGCTTEKIQTQIIKQLKLHHEDPSNISSRAAIITQYLIEKDFLLLLDDVWEHLDLAEVGIPVRDYSHDQPSSRRRKVILVSRREDVCSEMKAHTKIHVNCLKRDDAWRLFEENVGVATINSHPNIHDELAKTVFEECGGLPLALITIGRAMSNQRDPHGWRQAARVLKRSQQIPGIEEKLFNRLKFSYDYLQDDYLQGDRMRECFLSCALWPEDFSIRKVDLIKFWVGHGMIDAFESISEAYDIGHGIIRRLLETSLLEVGDTYPFEFGYNSDFFVKMHDVIRDMALWIAHDCGANQNKWLVNAGLKLIEAPHEVQRWVEAHRISLMHNRIEHLPATINTDCRNLTTLILGSNKFEHGGLACLCFFRALKYLDLSACCLKKFPIEICSLVGLEYLNLSGNTIKSVPEEILNLKNLKHLHLKECEMSILPQGLFSNITKLLVLDVRHLCVTEANQESIVNQLHCMEAGSIKALGINASSIRDVQKLSSLPIAWLYLRHMEGETSLPLLSYTLLGHGCIRSTLQELFIYKCLGLEELLIEGNDPLECLEILVLAHLVNLKEIIWKEVDNKHLFPMVTTVLLYSLGLTHATWILWLPRLMSLTIGSCHGMKKVIDEETTEMRQQGRPIAIHSLKMFRLDNLDNLACICDSAFTFPSLNYLTVISCRLLKKLPFGLHDDDHTSLQMIKGEMRWWDNLRWEDPEIKSLLPFYRSY